MISLNEQCYPGERSDVQDSPDQVRFEMLVLPHVDAAYILARWLSRSGADAEDVAQEALLRSYRSSTIFRAEMRSGSSVTLTTARQQFGLSFLCAQGRRHDNSETYRFPAFEGGTQLRLFRPSSAANILVPS